MAIFLQRYAGNSFAPGEKRLMIEMQAVIFTIQKTHPIILPNERNSQQFSHRG
jgi:hypothetical protein